MFRIGGKFFAATLAAEVEQFSPLPLDYPSSPWPGRGNLNVAETPSQFSVITLNIARY
jgi:hypothetical protein